VTAAVPGRRLAARGLACLVLGAVAMGASPIFVRLTDIGPQTSAFWRTALALPFLWIWARLEGRRPAPPLSGAVWLAGLFFAGDLFFWHLSILATTVANATFLATTAPIWVAFGAGLVLSEKVGARTLAGLLLCMLGGATLLGESFGFAPHRLAGDIYGLATAIFFGAYMLAVRAARRNTGAGRLAFLATSISAACLLPVALAADGNFLPQSAGGFAALLALAPGLAGRRPGIAQRCARNLAGHLLVAGDLPRSDRRRQPCLAIARRAAWPRAALRRSSHPARHLDRAPARGRHRTMSAALVRAGYHEWATASRPLAQVP
jgi:drug/metabolite transporter (DMT)-like permease